MKQFLILSTILTIMIITGLSSCEYDFIEPEKFNPPDTIENDTISFIEDVLPFFASDCEGCHKGSEAPDLRPDKAYNDLMNSGYIVANKPEESLIYTVCLPGGSMERYVNSTTGLSFLFRWIKAGTPNN